MFDGARPRSRGRDAGFPWKDALLKVRPIVVRESEPRVVARFAPDHLHDLSGTGAIDTDLATEVTAGGHTYHTRALFRGLEHGEVIVRLVSWKDDDPCADFGTGHASVSRIGYRQVGAYRFAIVLAGAGRIPVGGGFALRIRLSPVPTDGSMTGAAIAHPLNSKHLADDVVVAADRDLGPIDGTVRCWNPAMTPRIGIR